MAVGKFADMTTEEFESILGFKPELRDGSEFYSQSLDTSSLPNSVDWRDSGAVTPVKD